MRLWWTWVTFLVGKFDPFAKCIRFYPCCGNKSCLLSSFDNHKKIWAWAVFFVLLHPPFCCSFRKQDAGQGERAAGVWQQLAEGQVGDESAEHGRPVQAGVRVEGEKRPKTVRTSQRSHHFLCLPVGTSNTDQSGPDGGATAQPSVVKTHIKVLYTHEDLPIVSPHSLAYVNLNRQSENIAVFAQLLK